MLFRSSPAGLGMLRALAVVAAMAIAAPAVAWGQSDSQGLGTGAATGRASDEISLRLPVTDRAGGGHLLPVVMEVLNPLQRDARGIRFVSNQAVRVEIEAMLPAGQRREVGLGLWHFDGPLNLTDIAAVGSDGGAVHQYADQSAAVQALLPQGRLVLIDRRLAAVAEQLPATAEQLRRLVSADNERRPLVAQVADLGGVSWSHLAGSQVAAMVVPAGADDLAELREVASEAMIPLWTVSDRGQLRREVDSPELLGRVLGSEAVRPDLFDLAVRPSTTRVPEQLFRVPPWPLGERLRLLLPVLLAAPLLAALGIAGRLLEPRLRLAALGAIIVVAAIWTAALTQTSMMANVQSLTIVYGDASDGRRVERSFALLTSHRLNEMTVRPLQATLPPRPQLISPDHRIDYRGTSLHRDLEGIWSLRGTPVEPDRVLLFAFDRPSLPTVPAIRATAAAPAAPALPAVSIRLRGDGHPRLQLDESLGNVWLMMDGLAWRFGDVAAGQAYRPLGPSRRLAAAAYGVQAEADPLHLRVVQWLGRKWYRPGTVLVFGWHTGGSSGLQVQGARHGDMGRLSVWALARDQVAGQ